MALTRPRLGSRTKHNKRSLSLRLPLLLLAEDLRVIRVVFYEDEESDKVEGETTSAKEEYDVPKVARNVGGAERSKLMTVGESKGGRE